MNPKIIKSQREETTQPAPEADAAARILRKDAFQASVEARGIIEAARQQAEAILQDAESRREQVLGQAREAGYREGLAQWTGSVVSAHAARQQAEALLEADLLRLAVRVAEKIVGQELRTRPEAIADIVRGCMRNVRSERLLIIQVNPEDAEQVRSSLERLAPVAGAARHVEVVPDPAVSRGGCIVESELGIVDARLETQLQCLEAVLLRAAGK